MSLLKRIAQAASAKAAASSGARQAARIHYYDSACRGAALPTARRPHSSVSQDMDALLSTNFTSAPAPLYTSAIASNPERVKHALKQALVVGKQVAELREGIRLDVGAKELARLGLFGGAQGRVYELAL